MIQKPIRRKPIKPVREIKAKVSNPTIEFAWAGDMLTQQEYDEAYKGNVLIKQNCKLVMNLNAPLPNFPTGTVQKLYSGRGPIVSARNFLEL